MANETNSFDAELLLLNILEGQGAAEDEIINLAKELFKNFPEEPRAEIIIGRIYVSLGQIEDARVSFRHAVEKAGFKSENYLVQAAEHQIDIDDRGGALWTLTKALQGSPLHLQAGALMVGMLTTSQKYRQATQLLDELFGRHDEQAVLYSARANLRKANGNLPEALADYRNAYKMSPTTTTLQNLFLALVDQGNLGAAWN